MMLMKWMLKLKRWLIAAEKALGLVSTIILILLRKERRFSRIISCLWWKVLSSIRFLHSRICSDHKRIRRMRGIHLDLTQLKNTKKAFKIQRLYRIIKMIQLEILWSANKEVRETVLSFLTNSKNRNQKN